MMTAAPTAPTLSPDEIPAMLESPQFAELPPERRTDILERALADGASALAGQWDRETFQKWGDFASKARERVAGMESVGEKVAWAGGVVKDTAADMLKTLGVGVAGLSPVAAPRDAQGKSSLEGQVPGLTLGQSLGVNAGALMTGITDKITKDAAPVESGLEKLKQEIDQGAFFDHEKGFGGWLDDQAKALQEAQTAYYQDENWAQQNSLTANPENAAALQDYLMTRSPQAWDRLRSTVLRTPGGEMIRAARDQVTNQSALGRSLPGAQRYITEATDPAEMIATVGSLGAGRVAIQGGRTLLQRGGALAAGAAGEVAGEQVSAFMDDPNLSWEQRGEIAKQALVASLGLAGAGAGVSALAERGRTSNVPSPAPADAGQNPFAGPIAAPPQPTEAVAMAEDTGDLTAADVADLEPQPTPPPAAAPPRQPILQNVPDRMGRMRETSLNEEPVMEGDVITDLRMPRSPEALAESQRIENDRLVQEAKLRAQDAKARGGLLVDEFKPASTPFASPANQDPTQTITGSNVQTGTEMPVPPPTADAGAGAGGRGFATTSTPLPANTPATAATPTATATSALGLRTAANQTSGGGTAASAAASTAAAPAASGNLNPQAGRPRAGEAGFVNAEILSDLAASAIQAGQDFATWAQQMLARFGEAVRAQLAAIWQQARAQFQAREVRFGGTVSRMAPAGTRGFVAVPGGESRDTPIPEGQDVTRSRFANPDEAANLYDVQATEVMRGESAAWIDANGLEAALAALEANEPPAGLRIDHLPSLGSALITRLSKLAETGTEAQRLQADALLSRAGAAWHGKASQEAGRTLQQRAMANQELVGIAPVLAAKQVLTDRADRVVKERFEGGAEGAVEKIITLDVKAGTEASAELTAQLEGEPDAPELGDNPEVTPVNDTRVAELEQQMQELRQQMLRDQTQAENALQETTSTWQKIMGVLKAAGGRRSSLLTGAKGKLADLRKAAMARKAARRAEGRMYANPVGDFADDAIIGASFLAEGLVEFTNWSQALIREIGFRSGQDLRKLYAEASKQYLAALEAEKAAPTRTKGTPKQRQAREKINRAQRTAQNILDSIARRYSDPPIFEEGQRRINAMRELYKERVRTGMPEAEFVKRAMALGANEGTAGILWEASKLEIDAREMMALEKSRAGLAEFLKKDSPALAKLLNALRQKIAPGMSWAQIFMELPAQQKARQREIYRRLMLDERLKALNQAERLQLTNELDKAWQRERRKVFLRELEKVTNLGKSKKDKDKVKAALPRLLRLMNLGMLNSETFRGAIAQEYGIKQIDAATGVELRKLAEAIQQAPEGLPRRKLEQQLMQRLQNLAGSTLWQVLESWWTASVLSGWRTQVDIGLSLLNGVEDVGLGSIVTALRTGNKDVAVRGLGRLFARVPSAILEAVDHLFTGNKALMRNFELEAKQALEGGNRLASDVGAEMWRKGGWRKVPGGFMIFYGRVMTALDHITTASTREGALAMALARHPELYERALKISPQDRQAARNQARLELTGGDMPTTFQQRREENARVRELLERGIPQEVLGEATDLGRTAAMQGDPTGLGGGLLEAVNMAVGTVARKAESMSQREDLDKTSKNVLKLLQGIAPIMRAITGTKFARTVAHSLNRSLSYVPVVGIYAVGQRGRTGAFGDVLAAKQVIGTLVGLAMYLAFDDDEDEKGIEDGWKDKTPQEKAQLYAQGKQPYTVWSRNAKGQVVGFNYQQWGIAGIMNTVAAMLKQKDSEQGTLNVLVSSLAQGAMTFTDKAQLQGLQTVFGDNYRSTDPVTGVASNLNRWAAQTVGGLVPRVFKDIDVVTSPELRMSSEWWQKWAKEVPMLRQLSSGKRVDILGEDIKLDRGPLSRVMSIGTLDPAYRVLGHLNERDLYLPDPTQGVRMVLLADGTRRKMTELEKDRYQRTTGAAYRKFLTEQGSNLLRMPTEQARETISKVTERLRAQAAYQAVRR